MEKEGREKLLELRASLEKSLKQVVGATGKLLEPLRGLSDEQRDSVVMLGLIMQGIALVKRPAARIGEDILVQFKQEIDGICPPLGEITISKDPCFEATVAYLTALKKCQDDGLSEEECPEAHGPGGAAVMCTMKKIDDMKREIGTMLGRQRPPKPIPWPDDRFQK
ncbi:MAG: hypothetical protein JSV96_02310 [Candidatus Aminicenantes bacterium]|nr:MAG: hypothetical protein JSV96_02310 [Candidatus Aminicenantes bacterium]